MDNPDLPEEEYFVSGHNACRGCGAAVIMRWISKAAGPNTIIVHATGCMEVVSTLYPYTSWRLPWIHGNFENAAAIASGIEAGIKATYTDSTKKPNILVIGGDGSTYDIGLGLISGAIERGHNICYVCYDNEAYMNTGYQRSSSTPKFANTATDPYGEKVHAKQEWKKPLPLVVAAHGCNYVATATLANIPDLVKKVRKGLQTPGFAFILVHSPCVPGWKTVPKDTIELARRAVSTGFFPVYEIEHGQLKFTKTLKDLEPVDNYLRLQGRFKHVNDEEIRQIQNHTKWMYDYLKNLEEKGRIFPAP